MDIIFDRLKTLIGSSHGSKKALSEYLGLKSQNTISDWLGGRAKSYQKYLPQIAEYYGLSLDWLSGNSDKKEKPLTVGEELSVMPLVRFPVVGTIAAGYNCCALEEYTGDFAYFSVDDLSAPPEEYFVLRIKGNSMYPKLLENDYVLVQKRSHVENGKIAVVILGESMKSEPIERIRAALYLRVSTEEQKVRGLSIEAQETALRAWAKEHGYKIVGVYNDAGISARKKHTKRPALQRLLVDVENGKVDIIIFTKLDRWFRNISDYYKVQEILDKYNVTWKTIHEDYDTVTSSGRLKVNIMLSVAQDEADRDSERIKAVFDSKRAKGEIVTGSVPTGYVLRNKKLEKDPNWQNIIETFFQSFAEYKSTNKARLETERLTGATISYQLADLLLKKECYAGTFAGVDCPQYITPQQYGLNQSYRLKCERKTKDNRAFIFSGLVYCGECGNRYQSTTSKYKHIDGRITETVMYNCSGNYKRRNCTNSVNMREVFIEEYLVNNIKSIMSDWSARADVSKPAVQNDNAKIKHKLSRLKELYVNDLISLDEYKRDATELQALIAPIPTPAITFDTSKMFAIGWMDKYEKLSRESKRAFWKSIINKIVINPDRSISVILLD